jgi:hypothetical protein
LNLWKWRVSSDKASPRASETAKHLEGAKRGLRWCIVGAVCDGHCVARLGGGASEGGEVRQEGTMEHHTTLVAREERKEDG